MKQLLEDSKQQLLNPLGDARIKLLIILNIVYVILLPVFLISEKLTTGEFVHDPILYPLYITAFAFNLISVAYNIKMFRNRNQYPLGRGSIGSFVAKHRSRIDRMVGYLSIIPILLQSAFNIMGIGNPSSDAILTDFALANTLMIVVVVILGRRNLVVWAFFILVVLFSHAYYRGMNYEYHYSTPSEVREYKSALEQNETWALARKAELEKERLNPPKVSRYFYTWLVFILASFFVAYFFSGITNDILKIVPLVASNLEEAIESTQRNEVEKKYFLEKTNTFNNLAHETKTPLTLINNYLHEYEKKHGSNEELRIIRYNVQRLTTDIVNFYDLERFNKGLITYDHFQVTDVSAILSNKLELFKAALADKSIELEAAIESGVATRADPSAIERIINNLIENALKYTPENGRISIELFSKENLIYFSVRDNGIGIPKEMHDKIFEPYFQLTADKKVNDGMGLGLSIIHSIIKELKGEIQVISEVDRGTEMKVSLLKHELGIEALPFHTKQTQNMHFRVVPSTVDDIIGSPNRKSILIVEDHPDMLTYIAKNLSGKYNIYVASNGKQALEKLKSVPRIDLIISDVMMDKMDGLEFLKQVSEDRHLHHIPFIFLTAKTSDMDKVVGLKLGAIDYIEKPFLISTIQQKVDSVLLNLERQRKAVVKRAWESLLAENGSIPSASPATALAFEDNCKRYNLTTREIEIIEAMAKGTPYKIIGSDLNITEKTVNKHVSNIFQKVNVNNKVELLNKLGPSYITIKPKAS